MLVQEGTEQDMLVQEGTEQDTVAGVTLIAVTLVQGQEEQEVLSVVHAEFHAEEAAAVADFPTSVMAREHTHRRPRTST